MHASPGHVTAHGDNIPPFRRCHMHSLAHQRTHRPAPQPHRPHAGYVIPLGDITKAFWRYPMHYLGYHTYSLNGMMSNEFLGTDGWGCPCEIQPEGCPNPNCTIDGGGVMDALDWTYGRDKCAPAVALRVAVRPVWGPKRCAECGAMSTLQQKGCGALSWGTLSSAEAP